MDATGMKYESSDIWYHGELRKKIKQLRTENKKLKRLLFRSANLLALVPNWNKRHGNLLNDISKALRQTKIKGKEK